MVLPVAGLVASGLGLAIPAAAAALGVGKNTAHASNYADTNKYDANRFNYGGSPTGAADAAARYRGWADGAQTRGGEQVNYAQAEWDRQQAGQARMGQQGMADMMGRRAMGLVPSIAQMQADRQMQQGAAAQASASASARGAGGMALAQQNAANNTATMQSAISNQAQINAAQERMQAEQAAFGAYTGMRGGDQQQGQMSAQQAQYQAQLNAQQRAQNDQMTMGMTNAEMGVNNAQLQANQYQQGLMAQQHTSAQGQNIGISQNNANRQMDFLKMGMGATQGGADGMTGSGLAGGTPPAAPKIPPTGPGSDDQMKMGITPLGLLGGGGSGGGEGHGSGGVQLRTTGAISGADVNAASTGAGAGLGMVGGGGITGGSVDLYGGGNMTGGGMSGGLLSDDRAKIQKAFSDGMNHAQRAVDTGHAPELPDYLDAPGKRVARRPEFTRPAAHQMQTTLPSEGVDRMSVSRPWQQEQAPQTDPMTQQFAEGLAPIRFEYKPGMGPPGQQTGVRAQAAEQQPATASMITRRPDGLRQIDPNMGLSTALAAGGHNAQKLAEHDAILAKLMQRGGHR